MQTNLERYHWLYHRLHRTFDYWWEICYSCASFDVHYCLYSNAPHHIHNYWLINIIPINLKKILRMLRLSRKLYRYSYICRSTDPLDSRVFTTIIKCGTFSISTRQYHGHRNGNIVYIRQPINTEHHSHTLGRNSLSRNFSNFGAIRREVNSCSPHIRR